MKVEAFLDRIPSDFFTGVPDSQLKALCDALMERYGISERHIIAANEGNAVALATGHFLASGEVPTVYLQNSGEGNAMNPLASLCAKGVYTLIREDAIRTVLSYTGKSPIVSTTGKISREVYEIRDARGEGHGLDFLTVGSMGHASSIALGIALQKKGEKVFCLDGDGAALMHLGAMATIGASAPKNFVHILFNNEAHETVGGQPTVSSFVQYGKLAEAVGYRKYRKVEERESLEKALQEMAEEEGPILIEICCALHSRADLGRPKSSPLENKKAFMQSLKD